MNIEEERKAFLIECASMFGNAYYPADTGFANGEFFDPTVQRPFEVWLKAKAHAEEMRKPPVVIVPWLRNYTFSVKKPKGQAFRNIKLGLATREDAVKWAIENGYRVIE